jgi:GcrA cell cycle regulator
MNPEWTKEENEELRLLWGTSMSTRLIGLKLGKTKNAVIGRAHRMLLKPRSNAAWTDQRVKKTVEEKDREIKVVRLPAVKKGIKVIPKRLPFSGLTPISLMELNARTCRAIVGKDERGLATYCGGLTFWDDEIGRFKPFCETHCAIYYDYPRMLRYRRA